MKRNHRIFREDGKTVIVAMDHGLGLKVTPDLNNTGEVLKKIVAGGADAVLITYGIACKYADILKGTGIILRVDGGYSLLSQGGCPQLLYNVEDAMRVGADAVVCMGYPGLEDEQLTMKNITTMVTQSKTWGIPVMAEMLPGGFTGKIPFTPENITLSSRIGCEYGADIIKTVYTGTKEEFKQVIDASYQPVVILGGQKTSDLSSLFTSIENAVSVGAAGVAIGRNVWGHSHPDKVVAALVDLVHNGKAADEITKV